MRFSENELNLSWNEARRSLQRKLEILECEAWTPNEWRKWWMRMKNLAERMQVSGILAICCCIVFCSWIRISGEARSTTCNKSPCITPARIYPAIRFLFSFWRSYFWGKNLINHGRNLMLWSVFVCLGKSEKDGKITKWKSQNFPKWKSASLEKRLSRESA